MSGGRYITRLFLRDDGVVMDDLTDQPLAFLPTVEQANRLRDLADNELGPDESMRRSRASARHAIAASDKIGSLREAAHFLRQATPGPTWQEIQDAFALGSRRLWIKQQFNVQLPSTFIAWAESVVGGSFAAGTNGAPSTPNISAMTWAAAIARVAPLRVRLLHCLTKMFPVSFPGGGFSSVGSLVSPVGFLDRLNLHVFGNYVDLLESITYSLPMAQMLTYLGNEKANETGTTVPDENYARELMQLFTIGLFELNIDGTRKKDASGNEIPTYSNTDIQQLARVFTGLVRPDRSEGDYTSPTTGATVFRPTPVPSNTVVNAYWANTPDWRLRHYLPWYETGAKVALGGRINIPAGTEATANIRMALEALVSHPSCAPFVATCFIRMLVTSNPSPEYVARVASVFRNNGRGVVGDLKALWLAILSDPEAALDGAINEFGGRVLDGFEAFVAHHRSLHRTTSENRLRFVGNSLETGQIPAYGASYYPYMPSIFGGYNQRAKVGAAGALGYFTPELSGWSDSTLVGSTNNDESWVSGGEERDAPSTGQNRSDYSMLPLTGTAEELTERLNLLLCGGRMSPGLRAACIAVATPMATGTQAQQNDRASALIQLVVISPDYRVQL